MNARAGGGASPVADGGVRRHPPARAARPDGRRTVPAHGCRAGATLRLLAAACVLAAPVAPAAHAEAIVEAHYGEPVSRYGHYALGRPHEYARLTATTDAGRRLAFELPPSEVFEDLAPRLVSLSAGEPPQLLAIVSARDSGARLVLFALQDGWLGKSAESPPIGTPMRWLNPVGVADLDGDGQAEIAAVVMPHVGGTLKVWRRQGGRLVEAAALEGFSNHVYGTAELGLSTPLAVGGAMRLVVPDASRAALRIVALEGGRLVETGRCALAAPVTGGVHAISPSALAVERPGAPEVVVPAACPK